MKRFFSLFLILCMLLGMLSLTASAAIPSVFDHDISWDVLLLTNRERLQNGLDPLTTNAPLQAIAELRADELLVNMAHERPDGSSCFTAIEGSGLPRYAALAENIAAGYANASAVVTGWMNSPGHRANILDSTLRHMGAGYACDLSMYYRWYYAQFFYTGLGCHYTDAAVPLETVRVEPGTTIDQMRLTATLTCSCGACYLPIMAEFVTGYNPDKLGMQTVKCSFLGFEKYLRICVGSPSGFTDVPEGSFYAEPVAWAVENGITTGTTPTTFDPNADCMRAVVVTFLWRAAGSPEPKSTANPFVDVAPGDFFYKSVLWAVEKGITTGTDATHFSPTASCSRAQVVTFLWRFRGSPAVSGVCPFTDVPADAFYRASVVWAVQNGITNGVDETSFGSLLTCNRAQVVTFLYRAMGN